MTLSSLSSDHAHDASIGANGLVGRQQHQRLGHCLCHQEPVEWILMVRWQAFHLRSMVSRHVQQAIPGKVFGYHTPYLANAPLPLVQEGKTYCLE